MNKHEILIEYIESNKHLPPQGSKEWLADRKFAIGGSEISTIVGFNPYSSLKQLVMSHLQLTSFSGNIYTYWGSILEKLVVSIIENNWNCKIYDTGSINGPIDGQKYSPDGLSYIHFLDMIVLFEIKNPFIRAVADFVPKMYRPQVYAGLDTIKIADMAIFVDVMFKKCKLSQFDYTNNFDCDIHSFAELEEPIALYALVLFTSKTIDVDNCGRYTLEPLFKDVVDKKIQSTFVGPYHGDNYKQQLDADIKKIEKTNITIIPLKLFKMEMIPIYKNSWKDDFKVESESFILAHKDQIHSTIEKIKMLEPLCPEEKVKQLDVMFPRKTSRKKCVPNK